MRNVSLIILGSLFLTGCVSTQNKNVVKDDPYYAPIYPDQEAEQIVATGSLFNPNLSNDLYGDKKALRVGDILTVVLRETTSATKAANTTTGKATSASLDPVVGLGGDNINLGGQSLQFGLNSNNSFSHFEVLNLWPDILSNFYKNQS